MLQAHTYLPTYLHPEPTHTDVPTDDREISARRDREREGWLKAHERFETREYRLSITGGGYGGR